MSSTFFKRMFVSASSVVAAIGLMAAVSAPSAAAKMCFGKKVNRVVSADGVRVKLKYKDVTWISGNRVTVIARPYSRICADQGRQFVKAGKGLSRTDTGAGNDRIWLHPKSNNSIARAGLGDDLIVGSNGNDRLYGSPRTNPTGASDRDVIRGGGGNDRIWDYSGVGNRILGQNGSDRLYSLGDSVSEVFGGGGSDFIFSNGGETGYGSLEKLFGEQGNDRLYADQANNNGPVYLDGGAGDDWLYGTPKDDVIIFNSGIKKVRGNEGDDLMISASRGAVNVEGGAGNDTLSFATHTPPGGRRITGVNVDLASGTSTGATRYRLSQIENVIGSPFDDQITGKPGQRNIIHGGLGDDELVGQGRDEDEGDGGLGDNICEGFGNAKRCNGDSPGNFGSRVPLIDINEGGVLTVIGSKGPDNISIGYSADIGYRVSVAGGGAASELCVSANQQSTVINCRVDPNTLNGMLVYGHDGDDNITLENSIPANLTTTINGGRGRNVLIGGPSKDFMQTDYGSAGSIIEGRGGLDLIYMRDNVTIRSGDGGDSIQVENPCIGGSVSGGGQSDNLIFAGAARGVKASLSGGYAEWVSGSCANRLKILGDIEKLEGSKHDDHLIIGKRLKGQQGKSSLLGREGRNILNARNGMRNTITTGPAAHKNTVIADRQDKIIWGWGLAGY